MSRILLSCFVAAIILIFIGLSTQESSAVPSFARQTGKPCSSCHTMWPRLNTTGREFKLTGYTDVDPDYPRIEKDQLDLLRYSPLSLSVITLPYTKTSGQDDETKIPDEVALFYAGRITPNIGAFIEPVLYPDFNFEFAKVAAYTRISEGKNTIGLVGGKMDAGGADPYNTIRFTSYHTINLPAAVDGDQVRADGDFFAFGGTDNVGIVGNAKLLNNMLYVAAGAFRGHENSDPWDFYGRIAFEYPVAYYAFLQGGAYIYDGKERYNKDTATEYDSNVNRYGVDASLQIEKESNVFDIIFLYMKGKDEDVRGPGMDVEFNSWYGEVTYFYNRIYGVTFAYDYMKSDEDKSLDKKGPVFNVAYVPWLNTKIALEYSHFDLQSANEDNYNFLVHLYF